MAKNESRLLETAIVVPDAIQFANEESWDKLVALGFDPPLICLSCIGHRVTDKLICTEEGDPQQVEEKETYQSGANTPLLDICPRFKCHNINYYRDQD